MAEDEKIECPACGNEMQSRAGICAKCRATVDGDIARMIAIPAVVQPRKIDTSSSRIDEFLSGVFDG